MKELIINRLKEHIDVFSELMNSEYVINSITEAAEMVSNSLNAGGAVYLCGNGGSAADAQHIAAEFVCRFYHDRKAINAEALTVNTSSLTAIANDYEFENIFARQLEAKGKQGDVLIAISTSGTSTNVVKACGYAVNNGIHTILLTGIHENKIDPKIYECVIRVPADDTPRIQEAHIFIGHLLAEYVERMIL